MNNGTSLVEAGTHSHYKKWMNGVYKTICSEANGPCNGHGKKEPAPSTTTGGRWCAKGLHQNQMRLRSDKPNTWKCRGCERDAENARRARNRN